jgi:hypothetical protein
MARRWNQCRSSEFCLVEKMMSGMRLYRQAAQESGEARNRGETFHRALKFPPHKCGGSHHYQNVSSLDDVGAVVGGHDHAPPAKHASIQGIGSRPEQA